MIGCLIVFVFFIIAETIEYMTKSGKGITMTKAGRKKLLTTVLPLGAAAGVLFGIIIWCMAEKISPITLILLIGIPGALLSYLKQKT